MVNTFGHEVITLLGIVRIGFILRDNVALQVRNGGKLARATDVNGHSIYIWSLQMYLLFRMMLLLCACLCGLIHRRHLMVWAIFVPKIIFEAAFWIVSGTLTCVICMIM
jgi:hypothetical protein